MLFRFVDSSFLLPYILRDQQVLRHHQLAGRASLPLAQDTSAVYQSLEEVSTFPYQMLSVIRSLMIALKNIVIKINVNTINIRMA